jgi:alpha-1,6-mannosyltransferase
MSRIVQAANMVSPTSGGIRTTMRHLAEGYSAAGHEVIQIVPGSRNRVEHAPFGRIITVRAPRVPGTGYRIIAEPWRVSELLTALRPDRLEVSDRTTLRGLGAWAHKHEVRSMVVSHERLDQVTRQWLPTTARCLLPVQRMTDHSNAALASSFDSVLCTTRWAAEEFVRLGIGNLHRVPLGVDLGEFHPLRRRPALRAELGVRPGEVMLAHVSRLSPEKRNDLAIATLRELVRRGVPVRLVVAGDGQSRTSLERAAKGLPVTFLGFVDDRTRVASLLATADVVLAPGPVETFGLAALEALASGTPVVAHRGSALPEMLTPDCGAAMAGSGWTMADGVERLLDLDPIDRRLAARARAEEFPWSKAVEGFLRVHRLPVGAARKPVAA